jgi:XTP/dITP diphosphohydrolase
MSREIITLATKNTGKIKEIRELLREEHVEIVGLNEFGPITPEPVEDADTFEDNAYIKAYHYARVTGFPALADDSGLSVEALGGAPGVRSARWAGEEATDDERIGKLLNELGNNPNRNAQFVCALVLALPHGPGLTWVARCEGIIIDEPLGENGFGYDPVFFYPPLGKTFAQLTREEKNRVSHRGKALAEFKSEIDKILKWLKIRREEIQPPHVHS